MKKMLMVLMMVFGLSAVFAKSFVVLTDDESVAYYSRNAEVENNAIKGFFVDGVVAGGFPESDWKNFTQILVFEKGVCIYNIWVCSRDPKMFGISVTGFKGNPSGDYHCDTTKKTDPLQVGLNFIDRRVLQVYSVDDEKLVYNTYEVEQTETETETKTN